MHDLLYHVVAKTLNGFPVTSPAMIIAITKHKKSSETKVDKWRTAFLQSQLAKFTLISVYELWRKECGFTDFGKWTKWCPESEAFQVKYC